MTTTTTYRTITLTGRAPVRIAVASWPLVAEAHDYACSGQRIACQANEEWSIRVRRHADGRAIVYAVRDSGPGGQYVSYVGARGGELLAAGQDVAAAVLRVAAECGIPAHTASECVADLPAESLT